MIINSNATFDETVTITQALTIHGGSGFTPTLRGASACGVQPNCTLFFHPNSASPQTLAVSGLRLQPKVATRGMSRGVVRILNEGAGEASVILADCDIDSSDGVGFQAVEIRRASCSAGLNHVRFEVVGRPKVSIIIPSLCRPDACATTLRSRSPYRMSA